MMKPIATLIASVALTLSGVAGALADGMPKHSRAPAAAPPAPAMAAGCCCPATKFAGWYAGVHGGTGSLTSTLTDRDGFFNRASVEHVEDGWTFGGQLGYNWIRCNSMFGIEADLAWANFDSVNFYSGGREEVRRSFDWIGSIRSRTGLVMGDMMIHVSGGLAWARLNTTYISNGLASETVDFRGTRFGWVVGIGTEYAWSDRIRITGDVLYYDLGTETGEPSCCVGSIRFDDHNSLWVSRIGINFALGGDRGHHHATHIPMK